MRVEVELVSDGLGGFEWKITAPRHSSYHRDADEVGLIVSIICKNNEPEYLIRSNG